MMMAEVWAAAVATVGAAYISSRSATKGQDKQIAADKETARVQAQEERRTMAYGTKLQDYQDQLGKSRRLEARYKHAGVRKKPPPLLAQEPALPEPIQELPTPRKK
jgi:hypothetical protein